MVHVGSTPTYRTNPTNKGMKMALIEASEVKVGDKIEVTRTNVRSGTVSKVTLLVSKIDKPIWSGSGYTFWDTDSDGVSVNNTASFSIELIERKPDLAREMLDLYCSYDGTNMNRMARMRAIVKELGLVKG